MTELPVTAPGRRALWLVPLLALALACGDYDDEVAPHGDTADTVTPADATAADTATVNDTTTTVETTTPADTDAFDTADRDEDDDSEDDGEDDAEEVEIVAATVTFDQVHAVFVVKCVPCHAGPSAATSDGGHNMANADIGVAYAASQLESSLAGRTKGALALQYVRGGIMPLGAGCTGRPEDDADKPSCHTADEIELLASWVEDGQLPPADPAPP
jgi:hypothetical protein